jgi:hypothetical protein
MPKDPIGQWIEAELDKAPTLSDAAARRISVLLFGRDAA